MKKILVLNLGSTSSKVALFENYNMLFEDVLRHEIEKTNLPLIEQIEFRLDSIKESLNKHNISLQAMDAIACRGGVLKPIEGGTYLINNILYHDLKSFKYGIHASNLSGIIGYELAQALHINAYIVDPVVVDELTPEARITGIKGIERKSIFHALNQKSVAKQYAEETGRKYEDINVIVAHLGGGISVGAHKKGRVIDVNDGLLGEGPMSPERAGSIPNDELIKWVIDHQLNSKEANNMLSRNSGLISYFGTNNCLKIEEMMEKGDKTAKLVLDAMCYQISKSIGACAVSLEGNIDQIIITGGLSYSKYITNKVNKYVSWLQNVTIYKGEKEMHALNVGVMDLFYGKISTKSYE
ncbi:butyrate kinase [Mammaliicoccus stepanovicii]|uniref:Probable butyrate kinase n=1 Tax=Mammaliicoccus stepanovicii TaxID=643214 RepID=A0A239Z8L7_9STAP|nr:butyrate kinase [Mammaliicoccus stepanovicii]PNZ72713.1 butyrate kinase [Mammaliicoccus stepanovicii]GGI39942.1 putative butyrate kinase [Mammaliicoccus stepanovicii]SNV66924.1 butyrate kinase [Mammaliicoccus stepanovicii]